MSKIITGTKANTAIERLVIASDNYLILLVAFFFLNSTATAQPKSSITHYSTESGLSHDGVLCITQDKEGFMWFGTWDGINRFDGHVFTSYKSLPGDSSNLKNNKVRTLIEDKSGYLWVKTYDNLVYRFDNKKEEFLSVPGDRKEFKDIIIDRIIPVSSGDTWLLTADQGLMCAVDDRSVPAPRIYRYGAKMSGDFKIAGNKINFLFEDQSGRVWVGTTTGLSCLIKKNGRYYQSSKFRNGKDFFRQDLSFTCITQHQGLIYFGTSTGSLVTFDTKKGNFSTIPLSPNTAFNALYRSRRGLLYISSATKGLLIVDPVNYKVSSAALSGNNSFYSLFEDKSGQIWIEPQRNGIIKYAVVLVGTGNICIFLLGKKLK